jgi:hypothetical protein
MQTCYVTKLLKVEVSEVTRESKRSGMTELRIGRSRVWTTVDPRDTAASITAFIPTERT